MIAVGVALTGLILRRGRRIDGLARDVADLAQRVARIEGLLKGRHGAIPTPDPRAPAA